MTSTVGRFSRLAAVAWLVGLGAAGCGGGASLGETCGEVGAQVGECEDGAICGQSIAGDLVCQTICYAQTDCPPSEECNGVPDSTFKGCRSK
jgi:hypothetical protein